jgi:hypothetical protein
MERGRKGQERTSLKSRLANIPRPPSSQSMTGSAYSCIEAVKMTRVYQPETCQTHENWVCQRQVYR